MAFESDDIMQKTAKKEKANAVQPTITFDEEKLNTIINRIVQEMHQDSILWEYDGKNVHTQQNSLKETSQPVTIDKLKQIPLQLRPQLTGNLLWKDIPEDNYAMLLDILIKSMNATNPKQQKELYHFFRGGLDSLDLDPIMYQMLGMNHNTMGYWLPRMIQPMLNTGFFKIPKTTIIKVPCAMLQLSRREYEMVNQTSRKIINQFIHEACHLDDNKEYFVKTGTFSSKYNFRNAKVTGAQEVRELGEYLLYLSHQAVTMASPLVSTPFYGVSTTNEWVIREYIQDKENNPCIYHGMPLHTEYRVFVDFDTKEILGISPYWKPNVMKQRFSEGEDAKDPTMVHDYISYTMHEPILMQRYYDNKEKVLTNIQKVLNDQTDMTGQWSIDIMQNENDFWFIDMATADHSALNECVPKEKLKTSKENWIPQLTE